MAFKPKAPARTESAEKKPFVAVVPEDGLQVVQVGLLVNLGEHKKYPKFVKNTAGKREQDEKGKDKISIPKEGAVEQKVSVYIDLLTQEHDYGDEIGVKNIRLPLHGSSRGMSDGINFTTVAPRTPDGTYIKGQPWSLAGASQWNKLAEATKMPDGKSVKEVMFLADYKNMDHNNIELLLGKPFMVNVIVKVAEDGDNKYVNTNMKSPVPLMKGMAAPKALIAPVSINFDDEDLLEEKDELGGASKFDLIRISDLRKIVLAEDYPGTKMQEAVKAKMDEAELIKKAKEIQKAIIDSDKELKEILVVIAERGEDTEEAPKEEKPAPAKAEKPKKAEAKTAVVSTDDDDIPFDNPFKGKYSFVV